MMEEEAGRSVLREILPQEQMEGSTHLPTLLFLHLLDYAVVFLALLPYQVREQQLYARQHAHTLNIYYTIYIYIYVYNIILPITSLEMGMTWVCTVF